MTQAVVEPTLRVARSPIHTMLVPFPAACFIGTLLTDIVYWRTAEMMWSDFSAWLVSAGVILGFLVAIAGAIDYVASRTIRARPTAWSVLGNAVALILATLDMLVHTRDAWTSVVPWGLALSTLVVATIVVSNWSMLYRHGGVR
jgi:uncharacterized membrane protein